MSPHFAPTSERTLSALEYLAGAAELAVLLLALGYAAVRLRRTLLPGWSGPPALVADATLGITLAIVLAEALGTFGWFSAGGYIAGSLVLAALVPVLAGRLEARRPAGSPAGPPAPPGPRYAMPVVAVVCAVIFAGWAMPTLTTLAGGLGRADSLWYHMPLASHFAQSGSTSDLLFTDPIFFAVFYPANTEVLHAIPILTFGRDFVSPLLNLGFLSLGLLAAWSIGRPYGLGAQALLGAGAVLGAETMVDFQAGEALNDIAGVSFILCAAALLINGYAARGEGRVGAPPAAPPVLSDTRVRQTGTRVQAGLPSPLAPLGLAGAAAGLAAGTKLSFLAPVALLTVAVVVVAPRGRRFRAGAAWSLPMLLAGGYWYARNLLAVGNPIPFTAFGPLGLPAPERAFELRPGFSIAHYWNDTAVWADWFEPKLAEELGPLWPLILLGVVGGGAYAVWRGRDPILRALGGVVLLSAIAYVFTPLTAGGEEGEPIAFEWNVRYLVPAVAVGLALLPCLPALRATPGRRRASLVALALLALITALTIVWWPEGGHKKGAVAMGVAVLMLFAAAGWLRSRGRIGPAATRAATLGLAGLVAAGALAAGFLEQRHFLERRYENHSPELKIAESIRWARDLRDARIAISGVRGVFNQYAFSGTDLSNEVQWLGERGPDDAFLRIPTCERWREAVNEGEYDYVVTMYDPYLPGLLTDTKEGLWTRTDPHAREVLRDGPVSIFEVAAPLQPQLCDGLPDLSPPELNGDSVNNDPLANEPEVTEDRATSEPGTGSVQ